MIYEPREDSFLLAKYVREYCRGKKVLDVGCGSGILSEVALSNGAKEVFGVDGDEESVKYCKKKGINAIKSDLFSNVKGKFDLIVFNAPYLPLDKEEDLESRKITTGGRKGSEILSRFFSKVREYLNEEGKILIIFSSLTKDVDEVIKKNKFSFKKLEEKKLFFERLYVYLCW